MSAALGTIYGAAVALILWWLVAHMDAVVATISGVVVALIIWFLVFDGD